MGKTHFLFFSIFSKFKVMFLISGLNRAQIGGQIRIRARVGAFGLEKSGSGLVGLNILGSLTTLIWQKRRREFPALITLSTRTVHYVYPLLRLR